MPSWGPSEVVYQVLPDRFRRPEGRPLPAKGAWRLLGRDIEGSEDPRRLQHPHHHQHAFLGGDLWGVIEGLDHIQGMGATALLLNPIHPAKSSHRYDADDWHSVDPALGGREAYLALVQACSARGLKLILDGVLNHTSFDHPWHQAHPERYLRDLQGRIQTWMGWGVMPKLNHGHPEVWASALRLVDSFPEADGWRLDAAHLLPKALLRDFKAKAGDRLVWAEDWEDARVDLAEGLYDATPLFGVGRNLIAWFHGDASPETLARRLQALDEGLPPRARALGWTFLGNHDTPRAFTRLGRDERAWKAAMALLFCLPGTPLLYFGDEYGLEGDGEAGARGPMPWPDRATAPKRTQKARADFVRQWAWRRREHPALQGGALRWLLTDTPRNALALERSAQGHKLALLVNRGPQSVAIAWEGLRLEAPPGEAAWASVAP